MTTADMYGIGHKLAIYYEHPEWFAPLFAEFERRGIAFDRQLAYEHQFDPAVRTSPYSLIINRMSPSAYTRGHGHAIPYTLQYLAYLKEIDANVINGYDAYVYEFSKARQIGVLERLGIRYPRARVVNDPAQLPEAAEELTFPVIVKPNIGGSGAKMIRFDSRGELRLSVEAGSIDFGIDDTGLVQEYLPAEGNSIVRVEILGGEFLYAIRLFLTEDEFNLCPADYCRVPADEGDLGLADGVSGRGALVEAYEPPRQVIEQVKAIAAEANLDVGGVEYLVNERDGEIYFYDINALSNFVADAPQVVGFDPFPRLVDFLLERAGIIS
ncbi:MAG: hypothetical protein O6949_09885, partial [Chloroflexi bacterium]|nr:hypothetical protein [Chloroflexota bacterium]